jgi:hypothetical protein
MSSPITISLEEEEPVFEPEERAQPPTRQAPAPQGAVRPQSSAKDWRNCLLELLRTAPPEELMKLINKDGLKEVLREIAQNDPLLKLFFLLYG